MPYNSFEKEKSPEEIQEFLERVEQEARERKKRQEQDSWRNLDSLKKLDFSRVKPAWPVSEDIWTRWPVEEKEEYCTMSFCDCNKTHTSNCIASRRSNDKPSNTQPFKKEEECYSLEPLHPALASPEYWPTSPSYVEPPRTLNLNYPTSPSYDKKEEEETTTTDLSNEPTSPVTIPQPSIIPSYANWKECSDANLREHRKAKAILKKERDELDSKAKKNMKDWAHYFKEWLDDDEAKKLARKNRYVPFNQFNERQREVICQQYNLQQHHKVKLQALKQREIEEDEIFCGHSKRRKQT